ncbi:2911_t:CDS:1, partial [Cetraspora pellucida]
MDLNLILNTTQTNIFSISLSDNEITQDNPTVLQYVLPQEYDYIIDSFRVVQVHNFLGAYTELFEAKFCVNIFTEDNAKMWLD